jgi:hypothetical protein
VHLVDRIQFRYVLKQQDTMSKKQLEIDLEVEFERLILGLRNYPRYKLIGKKNTGDE